MDLALADQQREKNNQLISLQQSLEEKQQALDDLEEPEKLTSASSGFAPALYRRQTGWRAGRLYDGVLYLCYLCDE